MVKILVLNGDGINCDQETAFAFRHLGAYVDQISLRFWIKNRVQLINYDIFVLPGGFSFSDELGSGQVLAIKMRELVWDQIKEFYDKGGLILGICNGFQALTKLGLLPFFEGVQLVSLGKNRDGNFIDRWETIHINPESPCLWTKDLPYSSIDLPVRHGEGRVHVKEGVQLPHDLEVFQYSYDINGSYNRVAGLTDPKGQILGMMPHPEGYFFKGFHPNSKGFEGAFELGPAALIFKNAIAHCKKRRASHA